MPRTRVSGVTSSRSTQHPCKPMGRRGAAGSRPRGSAKKSISVLRFRVCTALRSGFKGDSRARGFGNDQSPLLQF